MKQISIGIYHYPNALKSSVYGLEELFLMANRVCEEQSVAVRFITSLVFGCNEEKQPFDLILLPPAMDSGFYLQPDKEVLNWLRQQHSQGSVLASACAGAFILASAGVIKGRTVTTHWGLQELFQQEFPEEKPDANKILIDHGDIISAGGMMSWLDLGLELVARYTSPSVMRQVGKILVVDTAPREQRYYQQFTPSFQHGDHAIIQLQQWLSSHLQQPVQVSELAEKANMTERTLQRRFKKATGLNPNQYLQRLRVQKACDLLETTKLSFEVITSQIGYEDATASRKVFVKVMGLTPVAFRRRFSL